MINILDSSVYNRISAGEVVERPASVVKELVENAIDAGAKNVKVDIIDGGIKCISVTDDGCGMSSDDLPRAFLPHATSKLSRAEDLYDIKTLGFRGEALASISAVAQVSLCSKRAVDEFGYEISCDGGIISELKPSPVLNGTLITVKNLFFNTPARAKFLKKPKQEESEISSLMQKLVFSNPDVAFTYSADNKTIYRTYGNGLFDAIEGIYGNKIAKDMISIDSTDNSYRIFGYVGNSALTRPNRNFQTLIINGRCVTDFSVSATIQNAYGERLMKRTFPVFVLNMTLPYDEVDVNVHPSKAEVKFLFQQKVNGIFYRVVRDCLNQNEEESRRELFGMISKDTGEIKRTEIVENISSVTENIVTKKPDETNVSENVSKHNVFEKKSDLIADKIEKSDDFLYSDKNSVKKPVYYNDYNNGNKRNSILYEKTDESVSLGKISENSGLSRLILSKLNDDINKDGASEKTIDSINNDSLNDSEISTSILKNKEIENTQTNFLSKKTAYKIIGQIFSCYIILEFDDKVYFIDQHAAHERILFDKLCEKKGSVEKQSFLCPIIEDFSPTDFEKIISNKELFDELGFEIEEFGAYSIKTNTVPLILSDINVRGFFDDFLKENFVKEDFLKQRLIQLACKNAIKAGDSLSDEVIQYIVCELSKNNTLLQCPHGRPIMISFDRNDFDKMFRRKK